MSAVAFKRTRHKAATSTYSVAIPTSLGTFVAEFSARGLAGLSFPKSAAKSSKSTVPATGLGAQQKHWLALASRALEEAARGRAPRALPPLDWSGATAFQQRVWTQLRRIPAGTVRTYAQIAAALGKSGAARAIGNACGANPIPVLVPCHRVTASSGGLGGFSGGLDWKRRLLALESVAL